MSRSVSAEVARFMFAGTRPNTEFSISFDLDVLKIYEDYDKCGQIYLDRKMSEKRKKRNGLRTHRLRVSRTVCLSDPFPSPLQYPSGEFREH